MQLKIERMQIMKEISESSTDALQSAPCTHKWKLEHSTIVLSLGGLVLACQRGREREGERIIHAVDVLEDGFSRSLGS